MSQELSRKEIEKEILELKLKTPLTTGDKKRIQKLQQLLDNKLWKN
jgi:hypothetical protein